MSQTTEDAPAYPGQSIGLPREGRGSLASWRARFAALIVDWAASLAVAVGAFGSGVLYDNNWRMWMPLTVFFVEATIFTIVTGGSFGQLLARIGVSQLSGAPIRWWQAIIRTALKCLVIPSLVIGAERRSIVDIALGLAVVNRR
ncbi:RDD family protein [Aestuariimicrobium ganziense]|uniref:RDD family protein n=1 Tax=Aestuariimicrobium ganziense TaxID=2773677 RepID=UPI00194583D7|nr:RDD family protein [Aestuariimicrobium ganziense]